MTNTENEAASTANDKAAAKERVRAKVEAVRALPASMRNHEKKPHTNKES